VGDCKKGQDRNIRSHAAHREPSALLILVERYSNSRQRGRQEPKKILVAIEAFERVLAARVGAAPCGEQSDRLIAQSKRERVRKLSREIEVEVATVINPLMWAISQRARVDEQAVSNNCFAGAYPARCDLFAVMRIEAQCIKYSSVVGHASLPKGDEMNVLKVSKTIDPRTQGKLCRFCTC
jgi:hypothetical protein